MRGSPTERRDGREGREHKTVMVGRLRTTLNYFNDNQTRRQEINRYTELGGHLYFICLDVLKSSLREHILHLAPIKPLILPYLPLPLAAGGSCGALRQRDLASHNAGSTGAMWVERDGRYAVGQRTMRNPCCAEKGVRHSIVLQDWQDLMDHANMLPHK